MKKLVYHIVIVFISLMGSLSYSQNDVIKGYRIDGDDVVFTFDRNDYEKATKDNYGQVIDFADLDIKNVVVSGEFNNWSKDKWRMTKISDNKYELRKHLSDFSDEFSWEFKFVINNTYWAEPSKNIKNIVDAKDRSGSQLNVYNLRMFTARPDENGNSCFKLNGFKNAKNVILSGTFNRWNEDVFRMKKTNEGWELTLQLKPGDYEYKFIVDGNWMEDPNNPAKKTNEYDGYNSLISIKVPFTFQLKGYENAKEILVAGDFTDWYDNALKMKKTANGWICTTLLSGGKHHYKFIVDGNWILDPNNTVQEYDGEGNVNSVCMVR